jgi:hypothetical protein
MRRGVLFGQAQVRNSVLNLIICCRNGTIASIIKMHENKDLRRPLIELEAVKLFRDLQEIINFLGTVRLRQRTPLYSE